VNTKLMQYGSAGALQRRTSSGLAAIQSGTELAVGRVQQCEDIQNSQVEAMASVTQRGLQGVAFISQIEQQLAQTVPLAAARLQAIGDIGTLGISQVVMDTANKLRRC
jgi:hypothetical protein